MELLDFLNTHNDWEKQLSSSPYNLKISHDDPYVMFSYSPFTSDMSLIICQEARGSIFRRTYSGNWICVCRAFDKFFNATEPYAATSKIDWHTALVQQKIDGSLIKFFYDLGEWHMATNGTIDARKAPATDRYSYYDLVAMCVDLDKLYARFDTFFTYMFELTTIYNKIVIRYEENAIWYLGRRSMINFHEDGTRIAFPNTKYPILYDFHSYKDCEAAAKAMDLSQEGFVVVDRAFNRIKIKGEAYLAAHHMRSNGSLTTKRIIEMWQEDTLDDFIALYPEYAADIQDVVGKLNKKIQDMEQEYDKVQGIEDKKELAAAINSKPTYIKSYIFARKQGKTQSALDFLKTMRPQALAED